MFFLGGLNINGSPDILINLFPYHGGVRDFLISFVYSVMLLFLLYAISRNEFGLLLWPVGEPGIYAKGVRKNTRKLHLWI